MNHPEVIEESETRDKIVEFLFSFVRQERKKPELISRNKLAALLSFAFKSLAIMDFKLTKEEDRESLIIFNNTWVPQTHKISVITSGLHAESKMLDEPIGKKRFEDFMETILSL